MKGTITFLTLLLFVSGSHTTGQPADTHPVSTPQTAASVADADLIAKEKQVWDALKRKDYDAFARFLAEDQVEVEPTGVYDKAGTVSGVKQIDFGDVTLSDFKVVRLSKDAAVVTYLVKGDAPALGAEGGRHSTVWVNRGGKWLAVFHQGTPATKQ